MQRRRNALAVWTIVAAVVPVALTGCGSSGTGLPSTVAVTLPDGTEVTVERGAGAASLADSVWQFFRTADNAQGAAFLTLRFGPAGELERFEDNTIAQEILGSTVIFDNTRRDTGIPGLEYAAATFGAETSDATGFSFEARLNVFAPVIGAVASGNANATGVRDPDDPDMMSGTFSFDFTVSSLASSVLGDSISEDDLSGNFSFIAQRLE